LKLIVDVDFQSDVNIDISAVVASIGVKSISLHLGLGRPLGGVGFGGAPKGRLPLPGVFGKGGFQRFWRVFSEFWWFGVSLVAFLGG
jgi:hypothetical protein